MKLLNPAGLWLLLGIPVLLLIYWLRSRYEDRPVSSTFLWTLSRRFQKKRLPLQKLSKVLLFLFQLFCIVLCAFLAAKPARVYEDRCDYIVILDGSASMQTENEKGVSRFDRAKKEIGTLSRETRKGHSVSVIFAGEKASFMVQQSESENEIKLNLNRAECEIGTCDAVGAVELAQLVCDRSDNPKILFYTDTEYQTDERIETVNMNAGEKNLAVIGLDAAETFNGTDFTASLESHGFDGGVTVGIRIDGALRDAVTATCKDGESTRVKFSLLEVFEYDTAEVFLEVKDALPLDNHFVYCPLPEKNYKVLLVSRAPLYLNKALEALGNCRVTVKSSVKEEDLTGYELYVFDGVFPEAYPEGGSVIQFGTSLLPEGVSRGATHNRPQALEWDPESRLTAFRAQTLKGSSLTLYSPLTGKSGWESFLVCGGESVAMTKENKNGTVHTVFSFDVHDSNLPLQKEFVSLMHEMLVGSVPGLVQKVAYSAGESLNLFIPPAAEKIVLEKPDESFLEIPTVVSRQKIELDQLGVYTVAMQTEEEGEYTRFFVHVPTEEALLSSETVLELAPSFGTGAEEEKVYTEIRLWVLAAVLLLLILEWGWYYREQL